LLVTSRWPEDRSPLMNLRASACSSSTVSRAYWLISERYIAREPELEDCSWVFCMVQFSRRRASEGPESGWQPLDDRTLHARSNRGASPTREKSPETARG